jgi:hypothetical protein
MLFCSSRLPSTACVGGQVGDWGPLAGNCNRNCKCNRNIQIYRRYGVHAYVRTYVMWRVFCVGDVYISGLRQPAAAAAAASASLPTTGSWRCPSTKVTEASSVHAAKTVTAAGGKRARDPVSNRNLPTDMAVDSAPIGRSREPCRS